MSDKAICYWPGRSGKSYEYEVYPIGTPFKEQGGNYIFCSERSPGKWAPQYIGQTGNLAQRLGGHEKEMCARMHGATHVHVHLNPSERDRLEEERDLIAHCQPICNEQSIA